MKSTLHTNLKNKGLFPIVSDRSTSCFGKTYHYFFADGGFTKLAYYSKYIKSIVRFRDFIAPISFMGGRLNLNTNKSNKIENFITTLSVIIFSSIYIGYTNNLYIRNALIIVFKLIFPMLLILFAIALIVWLISECIDYIHKYNCLNENNNNFIRLTLKEKFGFFLLFSFKLLCFIILLYLVYRFIIGYWVVIFFMDTKYMDYLSFGLFLVLYYFYSIFYSIFLEWQKGSIKTKLLSLPFKKWFIIWVLSCISRGLLIILFSLFVGPTSFILVALKFSLFRLILPTFELPYFNLALLFNYFFPPIKLDSINDVLSSEIKNNPQFAEICADLINKLHLANVLNLELTETQKNIFHSFLGFCYVDNCSINELPNMMVIDPRYGASSVYLYPYKWMYQHLEDNLTTVKLVHTIKLSEVSTNEALDHTKKYLESLNLDINTQNTIVTYKTSEGSNRVSEVNLYRKFQLDTSKDNYLYWVNNNDFIYRYINDPMHEWGYAYTKYENLNLNTSCGITPFVPSTLYTMMYLGGSGGCTANSIGYPSQRGCLLGIRLGEQMYNLNYWVMKNETPFDYSKLVPFPRFSKDKQYLFSGDFYNKLENCPKLFSNSIYDEVSSSLKDKCKIVTTNLDRYIVAPRPIPFSSDNNVSLPTAERSISSSVNMPSVETSSYNPYLPHVNSSTSGQQVSISVPIPYADSDLSVQLELMRRGNVPMSSGESSNSLLSSETRGTKRKSPDLDSEPPASKKRKI